ncbi:MAG TPA: FAD synthase [Candidatus Micrarchaeota archaeon]|nr:FAD synthase [Candidatus Micrarchaeota archaeon]
MPFELETIKKLFAMQVAGNGISEKDYALLTEQEKKCLAKGSASGAGLSYFLLPDARKKLTVVMTGGVFDLLHAGHVFTLTEAAKLGNFLFVVVATDETAKKSKGKLLHPLEYRLYVVKSLKPVDLAMGGLSRKEELLERAKPDVVVFGYDQNPKIVQTGNVKVVKLELDKESEILKSSKIISSLGY